MIRKLSPPTNNPICNPQTGILKQDWIIWFNDVYKRVGGSSSPSNGDLSSQVELNSSNISNITYRINIAETNINAIEIDINDINTDIQGINTIMVGLQNDINTRVNRVNSVGSGTSIFKNKQGATVNLKSLLPSNLIKLSNTDNEITIGSKTIQAQKGLNLVEDVDTVTISQKNLFIYNTPLLTSPGTISIDLTPYGVNYTQNRLSHTLTLICLSDELGYLAGEEVDFMFSDGSIHGKPYTISETTLDIYQLDFIKVFSKVTNNYVDVDNTKWELSIKMSINYI